LERRIIESLEPLRSEIDRIDDDIVDLLAKRMDLIRRAGAIKAREKLELIQSDRVVEVRERCAGRGSQKGLNPGLIRKIYTAIIDEAHQIEQEIISRS
jgi:chorismate mutase-like protein